MRGQEGEVVSGQKAEVASADTSPVVGFCPVLIKDPGVRYTRDEFPLSLLFIFPVGVL